MNLTLAAAPGLEPVDLSEALDHLRVSGSDSDSIVEALITAAREHLETVTRRAFVTQEWELRLDAFPSCNGGLIELPLPPLQTVEAVLYVDAAGAAQTLDPSLYQVDAYSTPGRLLPAYGTTWPATQNVPNAVTVEFTAGYGDAAADVPRPLRQALLLLVGELYESREAAGDKARTELPFGVRALVSPFRWSL